MSRISAGFKLVHRPGIKPGITQNFEIRELGSSSRSKRKSASLPWFPATLMKTGPGKRVSAFAPPAP
jgi:hypothetical protein